MMATRPGNQVCPICGHDDDVEILRAGDEWVMRCDARSHPPFEWRPEAQYHRHLSPRSGVAEELGVYDDLLQCVHDGFAEYGIVEYRFAEHAPQTYRTLVDRYGHTAFGPKKYTTTAFLAGALGQLWREQSVLGVSARATGYWSYNRFAGAYAPPGTPLDSPIASWEDFARSGLGVDPLDWPPLRYRHEPQK
jgi:hypothetical protein